jgi:formate--tetrahydrofolate ligase
MGTRDLETARSVKLRPIQDVAETLGLAAADLEPYGSYKAKVRWEAIERSRVRPDGALVLVTAMTPTPAGEGKSTTTIGLADGLRKLGTRSIAALRQPALGPLFGAKGGATGGGRAQVAPMEEINLHFTGDMHAIGAAHNLVAAMVDNHLAQGNALALDPRRILWKRVVDMNDRALRNIVIGLGGPAHGVPRESGFEITEASEVMAIFCLATDLRDFRYRAERVIVGETADGGLVTAGQLRAAGAMAVLVKDALKPNLVQTLEGTPALVHGGPFGNIAHGCSSLIATRLGLKLGEVVVTEAGFATDLGGEKFVDITCRTGGLTPACAVIVTTVRAVKLHGLENLAKHVENVRRFGLVPVVAVNRFASDTEAEVVEILEACRAMGVRAEDSRAWELGGAGATNLAQAVLDTIHSADAATFRYLYADDVPLTKKIEAIATEIYGADGVRLMPAAATKLARWQAAGYGGLAVCIAKTQNSLSDDATKPGRPRGFSVTVRDAKLAAGAGFVIAYAGDILTMPGLPKVPGAESIDVDPDGNIVGLF